MTLSKIVLLLGCTLPLFAQPPEYGGPSLLTRGLSPSNTPTAPTSLRPYLMINGIYDSGLTAVSVGPQGQLSSLDGYGVEAQVGVYGRHNWKHSTVGLDYRGNFRHYSRNTYFDGSDQFLTLGVVHALSKRNYLTLRETAGTYSRSYLLTNAAGLFDPTVLQFPASELFDNRVNYFGTGADLTRRKSARLSFNLGEK